MARGNAYLSIRAKNNFPFSVIYKIDIILSKIFDFVYQTYSPVNTLTFSFKSIIMLFIFSSSVQVENKYYSLIKGMTDPFIVHSIFLNS